MMKIYIPSRSRSHAPITWNSLPPSLREQTHFVVSQEEADAYSRFPCIVTPPSVKGIGPTRQYIMENSEYKRVVMLDDDLVFATRREDDRTKFRPSSQKEIEKLFVEIEDWLLDYAHVGVATREGGNRDISQERFNTRMLRILAYDTDVFADCGARFDNLPVMEDFDVTLHLLTLGEPNVLINWIVHNQGGSQSAGGCSDYRSLEMQAEAAHRLKEKYPDFVDVVRKKTKTAWQGKERTDVRIQWKKAYESSGGGS